jgi:hypothetical protein
MVRIGFVLLMTAVFCAACVASYESPDASTPSAVIAFTRVPGDGLQGLDFSPDGSCATMKRAIALFWGNSHTGSKTIEAGKRVTVVAFSEFGRAGMMKCPDEDELCLETQTCENGISFVPEQGHHYSATQSAAMGSTDCPMHIVDDATNAAPPTVQHDFHGFCQGM